MLNFFFPPNKQIYVLTLFSFPFLLTSKMACSVSVQHYALAIIRISTQARSTFLSLVVQVSVGWISIAPSTSPSGKAI